MKYTESQKIEILEYARDFGIGKATDKYGITRPTVANWNEMYRVFEIKKHPSQAKIIEVLTFARDNGVTAASREYGYSRRVISMWNAKHNVYEPGGAGPGKDYCPAQQQELLHRALVIYNEMPEDTRSARAAFSVLIEDFPRLTLEQLKGWNAKWNIVPRRKLTRQPLTGAEIDYIQSVFNESKGSIGATARKTGYGVPRITKLVKSKKITFKKGRNIIDKKIVAGSKKARTISEILSGLLQAKAK